MDWELEDFLLKFDRWNERDKPSPDWSLAMMVWIHERRTDPCAGARYQPDTDTWFSIVHEASDERFASCVSFLVVSRQPRKVRCVEIATLRPPIF